MIIVRIPINIGVVSSHWCEILFLKELSHFQDASPFSRGVIYGLFKIPTNKWRILLQKWFQPILGACLVRKTTLIWQPADDLRKTRMVIFPHSNICRGLSCVVSVLCRPQYCKLSISYFKYDTFFTTAKELKTILSRNGLVIQVFQFYSFLSKK